MTGRRLKILMVDYGIDRVYVTRALNQATCFRRHSKAGGAEHLPCHRSLQSPAAGLPWARRGSADCRRHACISSVISTIYQSSTPGRHRFGGL